MYGNSGITKWHIEKFGPPDKFGYKDFIPMFTCEKFDPDAWAELFKKAGAKFIVPTASTMMDSPYGTVPLTKWNAKNMGPKRDLIGDLAKAMRKQGLKIRRFQSRYRTVYFHSAHQGSGNRSERSG